MGDFVYRIKGGEECYNKLGELGWSVVPNFEGGLVFLRFAVQEMDSELPQALLKAYYTNPEWIDKVYNKNRKGFIDKIGLKYRKGKIVKSEKFDNALTHWIMEIHDEDNWVGFTSFDPFDVKIYYGKPILDKYCTEQIQILKDNDLIEEFEVIE